MEIDVNQQLKYFDGTPIKTSDTNPEPFLLKDALLAVMTKNVQSEALAVKAFYVGIDVYKGGCVDIPSEITTHIKTVIGSMYAPIIAGQVIELLEGRNSFKFTPSPDTQEDADKT